MLTPGQLRWIWFVAAIPVLIFAVWKTSGGLEQQMDVRLYDESYYLTQGLFVAPASFLSDYSALYSLYYKGLSFFQPEPIALYYLNYRVWAFLFSGSIFLILFRNRVHPGWSLLLAVVALSSQMNYLLWPKAGHFALVMVAIGIFGLARCHRRHLEALFWVAGICLLTSWARPEFFLGFVFALFLLGFQIYRSKQSISNSTVWVFFPLLLCLPLLWLWGLPLGKSGRGHVAFGQHFAHNLAKKMGHSGNQIQVDWVNWREIIQNEVGNPEKMVEGFLQHPEKLGAHFLQNLENLLRNLPSYFAETLIPVHWLGWPVFFSLALLWLAAEAFHGFTGLGSFWKNNEMGLRQSGWLVLPFALPPTVDALLFQPRPHYLLPLIPLLFWALSLWMRQFTFQRFPFWMKDLSVIIVLLVALIQLPDARAWFRVETGSTKTKQDENDARYFSVMLGKSLKNVARIQALQAVNWPKQTRIFDGSTGVTNFLGARVKQMGKVGFEIDYPRLAHFDRFVEKENINAILLSTSLEMDHFFQHIAFLEVLKTNPSLVGWEEISLRNSDDRLFFRKTP